MGLCEGGNEPPGSFKADMKYVNRHQYMHRKIHIEDSSFPNPDPSPASIAAIWLALDFEVWTLHGALHFGCHLPIIRPMFAVIVPVRRVAWMAFVKPMLTGGSPLSALTGSGRIPTRAPDKLQGARNPKLSNPTSVSETSMSTIPIFHPNRENLLQICFVRHKFHHNLVGNRTRIAY
ncbi:hypothetical protein ANN_01439 [Periplaneta americana]|uniref:Uncharacterized protein n=1 Tax=Periplaneta americana TaxID=6978 RepID=A0ABQ8TWH0_PERAM|nr:hypothetical protein ANN_01439 [Periplaneta americana]